MPNERKAYVQNVVYLVEGLVLVIVLGDRHVGHRLQVRVAHEGRESGNPAVAEKMTTTRLLRMNMTLISMKRLRGGHKEECCVKSGPESSAMWAGDVTFGVKIPRKSSVRFTSVSFPVSQRQVC